MPHHIDVRLQALAFQQSRADPFLNGTGFVSKHIQGLLWQFFLSSKVRSTLKCIFCLVKCHVCVHILHIVNARSGNRIDTGLNSCFSKTGAAALS